MIYIKKDLKIKDFPASRLAFILATRWTGNKLFFKGGLAIQASENNGQSAYYIDIVSCVHSQLNPLCHWLACVASPSLDQELADNSYSN